MKKVLFIFLLLITVVSSVFGVLKYKEYLDIPKTVRDIEGLNEKIKEVEVEIGNKKEEIEKLKEESKEEVELVEVWKEKVEKIKSYM